MSLNVVTLCTLFVCILHFLISSGEVIKKIACANRGDLAINCDTGSYIKLIYVNFGRTDRSKCRYGVNMDSDSCRSKSSWNIVTGKCGMKNSCKVDPSPRTFGDPCPSIYKYLEVHYECILPPQASGKSSRNGKNSRKACVSKQSGIYVTCGMINSFMNTDKLQCFQKCQEEPNCRSFSVSKDNICYVSSKLESDVPAKDKMVKYARGDSCSTVKKEGFVYYEMI